MLKAWYSFIENYCDFDAASKDSINKNVVYQFLHRTASACYNTKNPVLLYQLFYDAFDNESIEHQLDVAKKLMSFAKDDLRFNDKIQFYIAFTPILNLREVARKYSGQKDSLFIIMKKNTIYSFGESHVVNAMTDNIDGLCFNFDYIYSNDAFKSECSKLRKVAWKRGEEKEAYQSRIKKECPDLLKDDAFDKAKSQIRYNPKSVEESYSKKQLESSASGEEWRLLTNPGYTKYAVSSEGRVAFYSNGMGFFGKRIGDGYDVHHKINDGYNCRKENLVLLTRAQHNIVHMPEEQFKQIGNMDDYLSED